MVEHRRGEAANPQEVIRSLGLFPAPRQEQSAALVCAELLGFGSEHVFIAEEKAEAGMHFEGCLAILFKFKTTIAPLCNRLY